MASGSALAADLEGWGFKILEVLPWGPPRSSQCWIYTSVTCLLPDTVFVRDICEERGAHVVNTSLPIPARVLPGEKGVGLSLCPCSASHIPRPSCGLV